MGKPQSVVDHGLNDEEASRNPDPMILPAGQLPPQPKDAPGELSEEFRPDAASASSFLRNEMSEVDRARRDANLPEGVTPEDADRASGTQPSSGSESSA